MMKKMNLVLAILAILVTSGFVIGQSQQRNETQAIKRNPTDPCSPWFVGTVFIPCNTTVGSLVWNAAAQKYDLNLDERQLRQAYNYFTEQEKPAPATAGKKVKIKTFAEWSRDVRNVFLELVPSIPIPPPLSDGGGSAMRRPPVKIDLNLDYNGGKLSGKLGLSITI